MSMSFGGSFQTGPDSLYAGADLVRRNEQENLKMAELRRAEAERQAIANDPIFQQDVGSVRTPDFTGSGMTDVVAAPSQRATVAPAQMIQAPAQRQPVVGRVTETPQESSVRRMTPEEVARLKQQQAGTLPVTEMSVAEYQALPPAERLRRLQLENDRRTLNRLDVSGAKPPAALFDIMALPVTGTATLLEKGLNAVDLARWGRAAGIYDQDVTSVTVPGGGSITPFYDRLRKAEAANQPLTEQDLLAQLKQKDATRVAEAKVKSEKAAKEEVRISSQTANKRLTDLVNLAPQALQNSNTQFLIGRAQDLGVDPVAAVAIYGIESSYGATNATSNRGASGSMQVMDKTFTSMKSWFTDPDNVAKYNISPALQQAAASMVRGTPQGEMDAGLLVLKYNELIGVPKNLWGAGYQGNANQVLKKGAPLNVTDGGMTNSDYNGVYVGLYNNLARSLGGGATLTSTTQVAGNAPQVQTQPQKGTQQVQVAPAGSPGAERAQPSTAQVQQVVQQVAAQPVPKFVQPEQVYNPAAYSRPLQSALMQREQTKRLAEIQMRTGNVYKSLQTQAALATMDNQLYKLQGDQGVAEFLQSGGKDAGRMMAVFSYYTGNNTQLQPRTDGLYNVVINGKVASEGLSAAKIVERVRLTMDEGFRKTQADVAGKIFESGLKREEEYAKQLAQQIREIAIENIKGTYSLNAEKLKMMKYDVKPTGAGDGTVIVTPPFGSPYVFNPSGTTIEIDGVKVQSMAAKPITGMPSLAWANNG